MEKQHIEWDKLGFGYLETSASYVSNYKNGAWDEGGLTSDHTVTISECAAVLQYSQSVFEGLKAYTTEDGRTVCFRPDLNAQRMVDSAKRLEMPPFPEDRFVEAVREVVKANESWVPPYGSGATLYIRPYMFGSNAVIGVKPADEYQFRILTTPVGPYFKGGAKPIQLKVPDFDRAAPHGTGHIKAGLNYAMSLHPIVIAHREGFADNLYPDSATRRYMPSCVDTFLASLEKKRELVGRFRLDPGPDWVRNCAWAGLLIAVGNEFAPGTPASSLGEHKRNLKALCAVPEFRDALEHYVPRDMNRRKTIVAFLLRLHLLTPLVVLYKLKNRHWGEKERS